MEREGMFKELVESSDNIIIVTDPFFNIRYVSSAVAKTFELRPENVLGKNVFDFVNHDRIDEWKQCLKDQENTLVDEISVTGPSGQKFYFDVKVTNLLNHFEVQGLAVQLHDITRKKKREKELEKSNQQMDQVIYKTIHDLKAPLQSALGLVNLAEEGKPTDSKLYLDMIKKSLLRLDSFIEEMNHFFRNEKNVVQRELIDMKSLLTAELESFSSLASASHIDISLSVSGTCEFYSDSLRVKTIVTNLLSNAIKYSDRKKREPFIRIYVLITEENCQIRVVDNGIGIDEKLKDKIFELFFRATDYAQGTGLGLFIVKDTIQKLNGTIEVSSTLEQGTTFLIQIPNKIYQPIVAE